MQNLDRRIAALEQSSPGAIGPIFVHFVATDNEGDAIHRIAWGDREWHRQIAESEQELKNRAVSEGAPPKPGCCTVFLCF
jgi:hypothetical protein